MSISPEFPVEVLLTIAEFVNYNNDTAAFSQADKYSCQVVVSLMQGYIAKTAADKEIKNTGFYQKIQNIDEFKELEKTGSTNYFSLFRKIKNIPQSLGMICPRRILAPEEILSIQKDHALKEIRSRVCDAAEFTIDEDLSDSEFWDWLKKNPDLVSSIERLDLSKLSLLILPSEIGLFTKLITLDLSDNNLASLPSEIEKLKALRELNLSYNNLSTLPPEMNQLKSLNILILVKNSHLAKLPSELWQLSSLEQLNLTHTSITEIPDEIQNMTALTVLFLNNTTELSTLSGEIGKLPNLTTLFIEKSKIKSLPPEIASNREIKIYGVKRA